MFQKIWPYVMFVALCLCLLYGVFFALSSIPNRYAECEKAGGVLVDGRCIKKDAVIKV